MTLTLNDGRTVEISGAATSWENDQHRLYQNPDNACYFLNLRTGEAEAASHLEAAAWLQLQGFPLPARLAMAHRRWWGLRKPSNDTLRAWMAQPHEAPRPGGEEVDERRT